MQDKPTAPAYSKAQTLVNWISQEANKQNVIVKGENALASGILNNHGWNNIEMALKKVIIQG